MVFSSAIFLFGFLPITVIIHYLLKEKYRNVWLLLASLLFYAWSQPQGLWILACIILIDYLLAILIDHSKSFWGIIIGILLNVFVLGYFKYTNFLIESANYILGTEVTLLDIILPIGISFYVFKGISYIVDVYRGAIKADYNMLNVALYLAMFPEMMSGPIDRYDNIQDSLKYREVDADDLKTGVVRFIQGLAKKVIIANTLGQLVDSIWELGPGSVSCEIAWLGSIAYSLQIFFDFAGYSDMAIGIGRMLGFKLAENFNLPYTARNITDFWRRWHMTLGAWFKDYIYIPLGGNRKHAYFNLAIVFLLTGIWHGAAWTFIIWGAIHGLCRLFEKKLCEKAIRIRVPAFVRYIIEHIYLLFIVNLGWVFFRASDVNSAFMFIRSMFGGVGSCGISIRYYLDRWNSFILIAAIFFSGSLPTSIVANIRKMISERTYLVFADVSLMGLLLFSIFRVVTETYNTYIYFQF